MRLCVFFNLFQTEIAKRLNAICAQIIPFLSMDVSTNGFRGPIMFGGARPLLGHLAARAFGEPSRALPVVVRCLHSSTASFDQNKSARHGF